MDKYYYSMTKDQRISNYDCFRKGIVRGGVEEKAKRERDGREGM